MYPHNLRRRIVEDSFSSFGANEGYVGIQWPAEQEWPTKDKKTSGDVSELTANTIAESMYAMCDEDGHQILIFGSATS